MANDDSVERAAQTLEERAQAIFAEQLKLRLNMIRDAARDLQMSRDINGCIAGGAALGRDIEVHGRPAPGQEPPEFKTFVTVRNMLTPLMPFFSKLVPADLNEKLTQSAVRNPSPAPMPKVADVVLDRLRAAAAKGSKAADIRNYILQTYHVEIHEKTVGMTLYRLQKEGKVRRDGHTWFLSQ